MHCLLVLFPFGIVLLSLLAGPSLGDCLPAGHFVDVDQEAVDDGARRAAVHWVSGGTEFD